MVPSSAGCEACKHAAAHSYHNAVDSREAVCHTRTTELPFRALLPGSPTQPTRYTDSNGGSFVVVRDQHCSRAMGAPQSVCWMIKDANCCGNTAGTCMTRVLQLMEARERPKNNPRREHRMERGLTAALSSQPRGSLSLLFAAHFTRKTATTLSTKSLAA